MAGHQAVVDGWLERNRAAGLPRDALLDLFEAAMLALWARTSTIIGEPTLAAIVERVLHNAAARYPAFVALRVDEQGRINAAGLRLSVGALHHMKLLAAIRAVLVDFLTVLGNLTAGLLTPELHAELLAVGPGGTAPGDTSTREARP